MTMNFLNKKYGPFTGRCWGLFVLFFANIIAIHGAIGYVIKGKSPGEMALGIAVTVLVSMLVAVPNKN